MEDSSVDRVVDILNDVFLADILSKDFYVEPFEYDKGFSVYLLMDGDLLFKIFPLNRGFVVNDYIERRSKTDLDYNDFRDFCIEFRDKMYKREVE